MYIRHRIVADSITLQQGGDDVPVWELSNRYGVFPEDIGSILPYVHSVPIPYSV